MINRTNQIVELEDDKQYLILRQVVYKNETYYVTTEIFNDGDDFDKNLTVLKESTEGEDTYVTEVNDPEIIKTISEYVE